jgi:tetratricopeptide (TPR) repeat protein
VWQQYREAHPERAFDLLAVAADAAAEDARPWAERQPLGFPVLIDSDNILAQQYGFRGIPNLIVIDPQGLVRLAVAAGGFSIKRPEGTAQLEAALDGARSADAADAKPRAPLSAPASALYEAGAALYARGQRDQAAAKWREALVLQPDSFIIRKQLWRALNPQRFGETLDVTWQQTQMAREQAQGMEAANPLPGS